MKKKLPALLAAEAEILAAPLIRSLDNEVYRALLFKALGLSVEMNTAISEQKILDFISTVNDAWETIRDIIDNPPDTIPEIKKAAEDCAALYKKIRTFDDALKDASNLTPTIFKDIGKDLLSLLLTLYLSGRFPAGYALGVLLTLIDDYNYLQETAIQVDQGNIRLPYKLSRLRFDRIGKLIKEPFKVLGDEYGQVFDKNSTVTSEDGAAKFFPRLGQFLNCFGIEYVIGIKEEYGVDMDQTAKDIAPTLMSFFWDNLVLDIDLGMTLGFSGTNQGNLGLVVIPFGNWVLTETFDGWDLDIKFGGDIQAIAVKNGNLTWGGTQQKHLALELSLAKTLENSFVIGGDGSSGLEIGEVEFSGKVELKNENGADKVEFYVQVDIRKGHIHLSPGDGDGFLNKVLPKDGVIVDFDFGLGYDSVKGFYVTGGVGFDYRKAINVNILNIIKLNTILWSLHSGDAVLNTSLAVDGSLKLGPFDLVVEGIGIKAKAEPMDDGGNLGPFQVDFGFKPPTGLGLSLDTATISGGGFLKREGTEYTGVAALSIKNKIALKAMGILNTQLPSGEKGYSLLLIVMAEFNAVQLGLGFTLLGVGGLVGLHRSVNLDALREGVKTKAYDNLLFPQDPVKNAPAIIAGLKSIFPATEGRYTFGIMGKIGWGTPTLLTIDLGLIIELPNPVRFAILGVLKAIVPDEGKPRVQLRANFLGIIEFEKKRLSFDACIFDSKLVSITLEGDIALRASWGSQPSFLLSVGGFHPSFQAPAGLTGLKRLTINLLGGDDPRVTMSSYFAVTSNTVQLGARVDVFVQVSKKLTAEGALGFDALFQFNPFYFNIAAYAYLSLKWNGKEKMTLSLSVALEGPNPYKVQGEGEVTIMGIDFKVRVAKTWGDSDTATLSDVDVKIKLQEALAEISNWSTYLPAGRLAPVVLRKIDPAEAKKLLHPMGDLRISQTVVPLNIEVQRFGSQKAKEATKFTIDSVTTGSNTLTRSACQENFAPSQFREMSETEKISSPSFVLFDSGVTARMANQLAFAKDGTATLLSNVTLEHELIVIGANATNPNQGLGVDDKVVTAAVKGGPAGRTAYSAAVVLPSAIAPKPLTVKQEKYVLVYINNLTPYNPDNLLPEPALVAATRNSITEATDYYRKVVTPKPELRTQLQVIPECELV